MKIKTVKIKNFRGYGENKNSSDNFYIFDKLDEFDIIIFNGSNGNGKTSFYEAIEWCLSGQIRRLNNILKDVHKNIIKKSSHLIFNDSNGICRQEAIVIIEFDNGYILERKTRFSVLPIGDKIKNGTEYVDDIKLITNNEVFEGNDALGILNKAITQRDIDLSSIYKSISLGQENLASFLREDDHSDRENLLMQLFNLEEFYELKEKADSKKFTKLNNINMKEKIDKVKSLKEYINSIFRPTGYSVEEYITQSKNDYELLKNKFPKEINYISKDNGIVKKIGLLEYLKSKNSELKKDLSYIIIENEDLRLLSYLEKLKYIENKIKSIDTIKSLNKEKLQKSKLLYEKRIDKYNSKINKINEYSKQLSDRIYLINSINLEDTKLTHIKNNISVIETELKHWYPNSNEIDNTFNGLKDTLKLINNNYSNINNRIELINKEIKNLTTISNEYNDALQSIKNYVIKNEISSCPVCKSTNLIFNTTDTSKNDKSIKNSVLEIIDNTISSNKDIIEKKLSEKENLIKEKLDIDLQVNDLIINPLNEYKLAIDSLLLEKLNRYNDFIKKSNYYIVKNKKLMSDSIADIEMVIRLEKDLKLFLYKYLTLDDLRNIFNKHNDYILNLLFSKFKIYDNKEIDIKLHQLRNRYSSYTKRYREYIKENTQRIEKYKNIMKLIGIYLSKYDISNENIEKARQYDLYSKKENEYLLLEDKIKEYKKHREKIYGYFNNKSNELLNERISKYSNLGNYIYKSISPHPFYNKFEFNKIQGGREITLSGNENINLSHIFSNAQVNILALSIFLGIGLLDNKINIEQLFIDDPIQSMDDLNILAFIDLLRTISLSKRINKSLIISTHDVNFAKLLKIKLRNMKYKEIKFIYYGDEGPVIENNINTVN